MSTTSPVVNTDSFLVGASVQELWTRHCIAFAAVYGLLGLLALSRLTVPSYRPVRGHPIAVQAMFVMLCVCEWHEWRREERRDSPTIAQWGVVVKRALQEAAD